MNRRRALGLAALVVTLAIVAARLAMIDGLVRPIRVAGPSMSPTLWGPSRLASCDACEWRWRVHHDPQLASGSLRCFRCGRMGVRISESIEPGDRVAIDRGAYLLASPQRGDLVAIEKPEGGLEVKRVVGLPGERVAIDAHGRIRIDGQRQTLSHEQQWSRAVVVYDSQNRRAPRSRWRASAAGGWLVYHHEDVYRSLEPDAIRDDDPANLSLRRHTLAVADLRLSMRMHSEDGCRLDVALWHDGQLVRGTTHVAGGCHTVRIGNSGHHLWRLGGEPIAPLTAATDDAPALSPQRPLAVRITGDRSARAEPLWLGREVRFDPPYALRQQWRDGVRAGVDQYLVFGDNPPRSRDSRTDGIGTPGGRILGRVIPWRNPSHGGSRSPGKL